MRFLIVSSICVLLAACAPSFEKDSRKVSRSYLRENVNKVEQPPIKAFYNDHPVATIRVEYDLSCPGSPPTRRTMSVKSYENATIGSASCEVTLIETDFVDPFYISR